MDTRRSVIGLIVELEEAEGTIESDANTNHARYEDKRKSTNCDQECQKESSSKLFEIPERKHRGLDDSEYVMKC